MISYLKIKAKTAHFGLDLTYNGALCLQNGNTITKYIYPESIKAMLKMART